MSRGLIRIYAQRGDPLARRLSQHLGVDGYPVEVLDLDVDDDLRKQFDIMGDGRGGPYVVLINGEILCRPSVSTLLAALDEQN